MTEQEYKIIVFGGNSDIARSYLEAILAQSPSRKFKFILIGRDAVQLSIRKGHFEVLGANVDIICSDLSEIETVTHSLSYISEFDEAFICFSELTNQKQSETDSDYLISQVNLNFSFNACWINFCIEKFIKQNFGKLIVLGSVAGDLGRKKNYTYGAAKAGLEVFCKGVQHRIAHHQSIQLHLIKPGIIATKMTEGVQSSGVLVTKVESVGRSILKRVSRAKRVSYVPGYWRFIMLIVKNIPWKIFKRLDF